MQQHFILLKTLKESKINKILLGSKMLTELSISIKKFMILVSKRSLMQTADKNLKTKLNFSKKNAQVYES